MKIGENTHIEDNVVLHGGFTPMTIGDNVIIGHSAMVHAEKVGDNVLIGMGATVLHNVEIGDRCIIAGGAVVLDGMKIPSESFVAGVPAQIKGKVSQKQSVWIDGAATLGYAELAKVYKEEKL
ncbi:MAG: putative lipopolysaccharide biosynthesis O-acetyl transferase WbbJ [Candidatus Methanolliviera sp. GoM_asphalt]|nr:MAG: putative lipopolysaccharide biosynthesis O-acetyl transferase WbbJ [Candidatus Methanolliviera sp. GoM_asphalt]